MNRIASIKIAEGVTYEEWEDASYVELIEKYEEEEGKFTFSLDERRGLQECDILIFETEEIEEDWLAENIHLDISVILESIHNKVSDV